MGQEAASQKRNLCQKLGKEVRMFSWPPPEATAEARLRRTLKSAENVRQISNMVHTETVHVFTIINLC